MRPCNCNKYRLGKPYDINKDCCFCWLYFNNKDYYDLWVKKDDLRNKIFKYERIGYDTKILEFLDTGEIGEGSSKYEAFWKIDKDSLIILDKNKEKNYEFIKKSDVLWEGSWLKYKNIKANLTEILLEEKNVKVLIKFNHGLGDAVQFTSVLKHLKKHHSDWLIDIVSGRGKHSAFYKHVNRSYYEEVDEKSYELVFDIQWEEGRDDYVDVPCTKVTRCLREVFHIEPEKELLNYDVSVSENVYEKTESYLVSIGCKVVNGKYNAVCIHYEGNTSIDFKNVESSCIDSVCMQLLQWGYVPIILDWDKRSNLYDNKVIFNPGVFKDDLWGNFGSGDAEAIVSLISQCSLFIGIDSGPQKCAGVTATPSIGLWTKHSPSKFIDFCNNFVHLVPLNYTNISPLNNSSVAKYFENNYNFVRYIDLSKSIIDESSNILGKEVQCSNPMKNPEFLKTTAYDDVYYKQHCKSGLDYLEYGEWQENYGKWLVESCNLKNKEVLDIGCACGSLTYGLFQSGAIVSGCDVNEHMINLGRKKWLQDRLYVCDTSNLHYWGNETFDFVHASQIFEHLKPELVPFILREIGRVTKKDGILFACLDTIELFERQKRSLENEDATHICIRSINWWKENLLDSGWYLADDIEMSLRDYSASYLKHYNWDYLVYKKG